MSYLKIFIWITATFLAAMAHGQTTTSLWEHFNEAQKARYANDLDAAKNHYAQVVEIAPQLQWDETDKKAIKHSYLRLAELEKNQGTKEILMIKAQNISPELSDVDQQLPNQSREEFLKVLRSRPTLNEEEAQFKNLAMPAPKTKDEATTSSQKKWWLIAGGIVLGGIVYYYAKPKPEPSAPTVTYGF